MGIHHPRNRAIILRSVDGCDDPAYRDLGDVCSNDVSFRSDAVSRICINGMDAVLIDARQVLNAFLSKSDSDANLVTPS